MAQKLGVLVERERGTGIVVVGVFLRGDVNDAGERGDGCRATHHWLGLRVP